MPKLLFLYGPAASGKLTIAKELSNLNSYKLFHNHLTVDLLLAVFDFGSPNFIKHRHRIWLEVISDAIAEGSDVIFTFSPEYSVDLQFPELLSELVLKNDGSVTFVQITCPHEVLLERVESESRKSFNKLQSASLYQELKDKKLFEYRSMPTPALIIDSSCMTPKEAAQLISERVL